MSTEILTDGGFPITASFAALMVLMLTAAAMNTTRNRFLAFGKMDDPDVRERVRRASRAHGNTFEHSIPILLLMLLYEAQNGSAWLLCVLGLTLLLTRMLYIFGMLTRPGGMPMQVAAGVTYLLELAWVGLLLSTFL